MAATVILRGRLRQATYRTLIGLLAVTGMRVGEAIRLDRDDVDLAHGVLTVRDTKFGKSRELPVHPSTVKALRDYARERDRLCPEPATSAVLVSQAGTRLLYCAVHSTFKQLRDHAGLRPRSVTCRPRIHDFRHRFAVQTLLDWYRSGADVQPRMPLLSTYLGHTRPSDSYWYLTAAPELLELAADRLQRAPKDDSHECARADPASMVHRPADRPAQRQPAHDPRLPRHAPAAARLRRRAGSDASHPSSTSPSSTRR